MSFILYAGYSQTGFFLPEMEADLVQPHYHSLTAIIQLFGITEHVNYPEIPESWACKLKTFELIEAVKLIKHDYLAIGIPMSEQYQWITTPPHR